MMSRTRILDAAEQLFAERGYDGTATGEIAVAAGVTRTLVFHYFPTKHDLLVVLLEERGALDLQSQIPLPDGDDVVEALTVLASRVQSQAHVSPRVIQIIIQEALREPIAQRLFTDFLAQLDALVCDTIHKTVAPLPEPPQVDAAAMTFAAVVLRALLLNRFVGIGLDVRSAAETCARALRTS